MSNERWPRNYGVLANKQGWGLFDVSGLGKDHLRIERIDDMYSLYESKEEYDGPETLFTSNEDAIEYVKKLAAKGEKHAIKALEYHMRVIDYDKKGKPFLTKEIWTKD